MMRVWSAMVHTYIDFDRHNYLTYAAALAFFFLLSLFPLLIFLASLLAYIPVPNLFEHALDIMARIVPAEAMGVVRGVLKDVLRSNPALLSYSIAAALFAASGGFDALITILNVAYDVPEGRPYWKKRSVAFALTLFTGLMVIMVLLATVLGPQFGNWLAERVNVSRYFAAGWPFLRWVLIAGFTVLSVESIYFVGPNVKQSLRAQIPGAMVAVSSWIAASWALGWYLRHFANYNRTFGALGSLVGLMMWFYITALALMLGAEINAELLHSAGETIAEKEQERAIEQHSLPTNDLRKSA
jgi:membrane protein